MYRHIYGLKIPHEIMEEIETSEGSFLCPDIQNMTVLNDPFFFETGKALNLVINYCNMTGVLQAD